MLHYVQCSENRTGYRTEEDTDLRFNGPTMVESVVIKLYLFCDFSMYEVMYSS